MPKAAISSASVRLNAWAAAAIDLRSGLAAVVPCEHRLSPLVGRDSSLLPSSVIQGLFHLEGSTILIGTH